MKAKDIHELLEHIVQSGLAEVEIETDNFRINVKRDASQHVVTTTTAAPPVPTVAAAPVEAAVPAPAEMPTPQVSPDAELLEVRSPMIGTFYRAANPESAPFAEVGQRIEKGATVCIIEAMKLFNEIESEVSGTIVKVLVENATPVEYDQVLFLLQPD